MIVYRKRVNEAVNWGYLKQSVDNLKAPDIRKSKEKIYKALMNALGSDDKPLTEKELKAYGTSKKEFMAAIEAVIAYNSTEDKKERNNIKREFKSKFDVRGKVDDSAAIQLAKIALDNLSDEEYTKVVATLEDDKGLQYFGYFDDDCNKMFNINKNEVDRSFKADKDKLRGVMAKAGIKRKVKGTVNKVANTVKGKIDKVKKAGQFISGFLS